MKEIDTARVIGNLYGNRVVREPEREHNVMVSWRTGVTY
jgi:hypothetical protein